MIDFDDLDDVDANVQLQNALGSECLPEGLARSLEKMNEGEDESDMFGEDDAFDCAKEPRRVLQVADVRCDATEPAIAVLVPYREDDRRTRGKQLQVFVRHFRDHFLPALPRGLRAKVVILEQTDNGNFNRGKLLNIGARWSRAYLEHEVILCPHDVDMLPDASLAPYYSHYRSGECVHLGWVNRKYDYQHFFGGANAIPLQDFLAAGGFPNDFWGWGREDDVLHGRLRVLARSRVLVPAAEGGMTFQAGDVSGVGRPTPRSVSENRISAQHLMGFDNIFDPPTFTVLDHEERGWLTHLLLDLQPERGTQPPRAGVSARVLDGLLGSRGAA